MSSNEYGFDDYFGAIPNSPPAYYYPTSLSRRGSQTSRRRSDPSTVEDAGYSAIATGYVQPPTFLGSGQSQRRSSATSGGGGGFEPYASAFDFMVHSPTIASPLEPKPALRSSTERPDKRGPNWAYGIEQCTTVTIEKPNQSLPIIGSPSSHTPDSSKKTVSAPTIAMIRSPLPPPKLPGGPPTSAGASKKTVVAPVRSAVVPPPARQRRLSEQAQKPSPLASHQLDPLQDFHPQGQQPHSPKVEPVPSFRTWQQGRAATPSVSAPPAGARQGPNKPEITAERHITITKRMQRAHKSPQPKMDKIDDNAAAVVRAPAIDSPLMDTWLAPSAVNGRRRSSTTEDDKVRSGRTASRAPRVSISSGDLFVQAPLSTGMSAVMRPKRVSVTSPPTVNEGPADRRRRRTGSGKDAATLQLESSLMRDNQLRSSGLSLSTDSGMSGPPMTRNPQMSSMLPRTRAGLLNGAPPQRGVRSSLVVNGRAQDTMPDSVENSMDSGGVGSLRDVASQRFVPDSMRQSLDHSFTPQLEASRTVRDLSDGDEDDDDHDVLGLDGTSHMPSMFRRSHTRRVSDASRHRRRLQRANSYDWLTGVASAGRPQPKGSFSYMAGALTAEDASDSDEAMPHNSDDDISIHSSSGEDEEDPEDDSSNSDDDVCDSSAIQGPRVAHTRRVVQPRTSGSGPDMGEWRPTGRAPQPQPNLPLYIGRGGCIINAGSTARTRQPPVAAVLGLDINMIAVRVPSPDWSCDPMSMPSFAPSPGVPMMAMQQMAMMNGRGMR